MRFAPQFVALTVLLLLACGTLAEDGYSERALQGKQRFADEEVAAIAEPYVGVRSSTGVREGLFAIEATGVPTTAVRQAADLFLGLLSTLERIRVHYSVDAPEWRKWLNVDNAIYVRDGLSLAEMTDTQREAALGLMSASLSHRGFELSRNIMKTDRTLAEINADKFGLDEDLYFFTVMGVPSDEEPWGWQVDGHHLIINYFVMGDQVVMTPLFLGGEPVVTMSGEYAGNVILQNEQKEGLALLQSLDEEQRAAAIIASEKISNDMVAGAGKDNLVLDPEGIAGADLDDQQRIDLLNLIELYVGNMDEGHAAVRMAEVEEHLDDTYFAWVGGTDDQAVFYYRIHSPVILIEFDHQRPVGMRRLLTTREPTRQHIHTVVRTPNGNDYGKDLLRQHLQDHPH
jgi:hypothetical protein